MTADKVIVKCSGISKHFPYNKGVFGKPSKFVKAVNDVDLAVYKGETFGLVGESGCGKSTLGRLLLRLLEPTSGTLFYDDADITRLDKEPMRMLRQKMQIIFQDPYASLNPRMTVYENIVLSLNSFNLGDKQERQRKVLKVLSEVGIARHMMHRYPHEFSGGQRQRMVIARALVLEPEFVVCDEPVSALDMSVRSQVINLMSDLRDAYSLTYLFISHDLSVVRHICSRVAVMYLGKIVELADSETLFNNPVHPYTRALLSAIPVPDVGEKPKRIVLEGDIPNPLNLPPGCAFHTRCAHAVEQCKTVEPVLNPVSEGHSVACHLHSKQTGI